MIQRRKAVSRIDRRFYSNFDDNWDDSLLREKIVRKITLDSIVLDLGAGAGIVKQLDFRGLAARICGVDLDPRVERNPFLDEGKVADGRPIPYPDASFDLVFADNVLEHLSEPKKVFEEVARVLKPGGAFVFKTPNKWHYMPLISRLTPHSFHRWVNHKRGRSGVDTFPTLYRANSAGDIRRLAKAVDLEIEAIELIEGRPEYLRIHPATYLLGLAYERLVNRLPFLSGMKIILTSALKKPS